MFHIRHKLQKSATTIHPLKFTSVLDKRLAEMHHSLVITECHSHTIPLHVNETTTEM